MSVPSPTSRGQRDTFTPALKRLRGGKPESRTLSLCRALAGAAQVGERGVIPYPRTVMYVQAGGWDGFSLPSSRSLPELQDPGPACVVGRVSPTLPAPALPSQQMNTRGPVGDTRFLAASALWGNKAYCIHLTDNRHMLMRVIC